MVFFNQKFVLAVTVGRLTRYTIATKTAIEIKQALCRVILDFGRLITEQKMFFITN